MRRRVERWLDAYRDRALPPAQRERVKRAVEAEPAYERRVAETEALGRAVREAWSEGPPAPAPDLLIAKLRPEMGRADLEGRRVAGGRFGSLFAGRGGLLPPLSAAALAGAALIAVLFTWPGPPGPAPESVIARIGSLESPAAIYDLAQGDQPLLIFEGEDGSTVIWILDDQDDGLSQGPRAAASEGWA